MKYVLKTPERHRSGVFIVNFEHISLSSSISIVNFEYLIAGWVKHNQQMGRFACFGNICIIQETWKTPTQEYYF